ncbi:YcjX family protein, partial [Paracoccus sanguinis]|uniref:YcjX family protein n=1 Tax=Paracoccus sanguinis TaxID=1545044 RepID=UPI00051F9D9D
MSTQTQARAEAALPELEAGTAVVLPGPAPPWPGAPRHVSELRLSLRVQPRGLLGGLRGTQTLHLDIVDYPGEWLLDL